MIQAFVLAIIPSNVEEIFARTGGQHVKEIEGSIDGPWVDEKLEGKMQLQGSKRTRNCRS